MQIVIDIDDGIARGIIDGKGDAPRNIVRSFQATIADAIKNGTPLPKGITNGGIIKAMFPNIDFIETDSACVYYGVNMRSNKDWWDAPYKAQEVKQNEQVD